MNGGCRLVKAILAGMGRKEKDAPTADLPAVTPEREGSTEAVL
jgi:hypothetical protein